MEFTYKETYDGYRDNITSVIVRNTTNREMTCGYTFPKADTLVKRLNTHTVSIIPHRETEIKIDKNSGMPVFGIPFFSDK